MNCQNIRAKANLKSTPQDFIVDEQLGFELTGEGEHLWCYVEKIAMNTSYLERQWCKLLDCQRREITHSGLKDRHALTRQWLCLPAIYSERLPDEGEGWRIIKRQLHRKKLRIGTHKSNAFRITLRDVVGGQDRVDNALQRIREWGFLNTFAEQRFGHDNLAKAKQWIERQQLPKKREERAQVLSTLRAFLFNAQVAHRQSLGLIDQFVPGDRAMLAGSHSHFVVTEVDATLTQRLQQGDITPGAMLVGVDNAKQETSQNIPQAEQIREQVLQRYPAMVDYLQTHCQADWREISVRPRQFTWTWQSHSVLTLNFELPKGSFATSLLGQVFNLTDISQRQT